MRGLCVRAWEIYLCSLKTHSKCSCQIISVDKLLSQTQQANKSRGEQSQTTKSDIQQLEVRL